MKRLILLPVLLAAFTATGQMTLEHTYTNTYQLSVVNIEDEGNKFVDIDTTTKHVILYNADHSVWKDIPATAPTGARPFITCVSKKLFDNDNQIELGYTYYTLSNNVPTYHAYIYKDDGTAVYTFTDVSNLTPVKVNNTWKIVAQKYPATTTFDVYGVPGQYLSLLKPNSGGQDGEVAIYPNPMNNAATLRYTLPAGANTGTIEIYSLSGVKIRTYQITNAFSELLISKNDLAPGTYVYSMIASNGNRIDNKFIIE